MTVTSSPDLETRVRQLSVACEVSRLFSELIEQDRLIAFVINKTKELLEAESSAVLLLDAKTNELYFPYTADLSRDVERRFAEIRFRADAGLAGWVLQHGQAQLVPDVSKDPRWYSQVDRQSGMETSALLCAPLRVREGIIGVIELRNKVSGAFTNSDLRFLEMLADGIATAITNAQRFKEVRDAELRLRAEVAALNSELAHHSGFRDIIGTSRAMQPVFRLMESAIRSPITVLLEGETGTGKELIARTIHSSSERKDRPFVAVNCAALPEELLESELFGHRKGAFTGAVSDKQGLFTVADRGTVFLDEIGEMPFNLQAKLLRVLQDGSLRPVGETQDRRIDVRIIPATNRDLEAEVKKGRFREDLFYRLNAFPIRIPPLRVRHEDVPVLALRLLEKASQRFRKTANGLTDKALEALSSYSWPGNVRELDNEIERALALVADEESIDVAQLSEKVALGRLVRVPSGAAPTSLKRARETFEHEYVAEILRQHGGNATRTAKVLGISRVMLQKKIKQYDLREK